MAAVVERYKAWDRDEVDAILEARRIRPAPGAGQQRMDEREDDSECEVQLLEEQKENEREEDDEGEGGVAVRTVGKGKDEIVRRRKSAPLALHTNGTSSRGSADVSPTLSICVNCAAPRPTGGPCRSLCSTT